MNTNRGRSVRRGSGQEAKGLTEAGCPKRNITEETRTLGALLRLPYEVLQVSLYTALARQGFEDIRPAHSAVFRHILPQGSRVVELAERAQMTKQGMAYLTEYLAEHGYVRFVTDPRDGRAKLVQLTERGKSVQESLIALGREVETDLTDRMGGKRMEQLRYLLERLGSILERTRLGEQS